MVVVVAKRKPHFHSDSINNLNVSTQKPFEDRQHSLPSPMKLSSRRRHYLRAPRTRSPTDDHDCAPPYTLSDSSNSPSMGPTSSSTSITVARSHTQSRPPAYSPSEGYTSICASSTTLSREMPEAFGGQLISSPLHSQQVNSPSNLNQPCQAAVHEYTHVDKGNNLQLIVQILSQAKSGLHIPRFSGESLIQGSVEVQYARPEDIKSVDVSVNLFINSF